jgi:hypothetical protein
MKVVSEGTASLLGGTDAPINMGISTDPEDQLMILNVLSNSLYTDKVAAVLREYGCNAFDANVEAGRGHQPIEIRLPNRLDPTLAIRDFGYGMSQDQILNVFCRLGRSTKRQSNAFTGMLGIGSKAGFAYGDSFVVTSFNGGSKTVYNCFRDQGAPRLAKMHEEPSDSPDGIEVKVPIRVGDFQEFITKAERIYRYFKVRPIIHGVSGWTWTERGVAEFQGTGWRYTGVGNSVAIMGNVGYTLSGSALPLATAERLRTLITLGVELDFEIGDLEIAANREGLQYKEHTIKSIVARLTVVADEVTKVFTDRIAKAPSLWDAHRMYGDNFEKMGQSTYGMRTLKEVVDKGITWNGIKIQTGRFPLLPQAHVGGIYPGVHIVEYHKDRYYASRTQKRDNPGDTYASEKTQLCINDLPSATNSPSRVKGFFETKTTFERLVTFTFENDIAKKKYWKAVKLDGAPTINLSAIPPSLIVSTSSSGSSGPSMWRAKHSSKVFELVKNRPTNDSSVKSKWWEKAEVDLENDSGIYVKIHKFEAQLADGPQEPINFHNCASALIKAGIITGTIYGFKPAMIDRLGKGWVSLEDHIKANLYQWVNANKQTVADADAALAHKEWIRKSWARHFCPKTAMHKYLRSFEWMVENGKKTSDMVDSIRRGYNCLLKKSVLDKLPKPTHDLDALSKDVQRTYPLLAILNKQSPYVWGDDRYATANASLLQSCKEYVQLVNK